MSGGLFAQFCIDTCAILDLFGRRFPRDIYPNLWPTFESATEQGSIISIREVYREIKARDDSVAQWAKNRSECFHDPDDAQMAAVRRIANAHPECLDLLKRRAANADPWVVAAASAWGLVVVTSERVDSPRKIPAICKLEGVECVDLFGLFRRLGWTFETGSGAA